MLLSLEQAVQKYGAIDNGRWADEEKWCRIVKIPDDISLNWINSATRKPTQHVYCNSDMAHALLIALQNIRDRNLLHELKTFDGCFQIRDVRAEPGKPSCHSYALAIDVNAQTNPLGCKPTLSLPFVQCWKDAGFTWGGEFHRVDGMHMSYAWE